ncbi:MAG: hypothetical protein U5J98_11715 [Halobacteriales archaeon]|nr:hypothetical protein [Halobacteriales archaeon]
MDWLKYAAIAGLLVVATLAGGAAVRLVVAAGNLRGAATLALVALLVVATALVGAKGRRWRSNPYW